MSSSTSLSSSSTRIETSGKPPPTNQSDQPTTSAPKLSNSGTTLPSIGMKWGREPNPSSASTSTSISRSVSTDDNKTKNKKDEDDNDDDDDDDGKPDFSTYFSPTEQAALRAKGINPTLKAEMDWSRNKSEGKGFWGKLAGTALGGGWIK